MDNIELMSIHLIKGANCFGFDLHCFPSEKTLSPGLYLIMVNNYKTIVIINDSSNPVHPIVVVKAKP